MVIIGERLRVGDVAVIPMCALACPSAGLAWATKDISFVPRPPAFISMDTRHILVQSLLGVNEGSA